MTVIYVGNIGRSSTEATVRAAFEVYGSVANVKVKSGFAVVEMKDEVQAKKAISDLNDHSSWVVRRVGAVA